MTIASPIPGAHRAAACVAVAAAIAGCGGSTATRAAGDAEPAQPSEASSVRVSIAPVPDAPTLSPARERPTGTATLRQVAGLLTGTVDVRGLRPDTRYVAHVHRGDPRDPCYLRADPTMALSTFLSDSTGRAHAPLREVARAGTSGEFDRGASAPDRVAADTTAVLDGSYALHLHCARVIDPTVDGGWGPNLACGNVPRP